jgi:hypothetical protein
MGTGTARKSFIYKVSEIQKYGRPERVEPMAQPATSLTRWPVFICERHKTERRDQGQVSAEDQGIRRRKKTDVEIRTG